MRETRLQSLRNLRRRANLETCSFNGIDGLNSERELPKSWSQVDAFIKDVTGSYRETWVLPIIDELIAAEEKRRTRRTNRAEGGGA